MKNSDNLVVFAWMVHRCFGQVKKNFTNQVSVPQADLLIEVLLVIRKLPMIQSPGHFRTRFMSQKGTVLKESIANNQAFIMRQ